MSDLEQRVLDVITWRRVWEVPTRSTDLYRQLHRDHYRLIDDATWNLIQTARVRLNADSTLEPLGDRL